MVFPSVPRKISKCVSVEQVKYLNYTDSSAKKIFLQDFQHTKYLNLVW